MIELIYLFMVYAIIGWLWETPYVSIGQKKFVNRGFLRGPYIPIYGLACITIIYSIRLLPPFEINIFSVLFVILFVALVSAVWEYATSWSLEKIFRMRWWDYSHHKFNLNGRVCLDYAILFGLGGFILWYFVNPMLISIYNNIDEVALFTILFLFYGIFIVDTVYTLRGLVHVRTIILSFEKVRDELSFKYDEFVTQLQLSTDDTIAQINEFVTSIKLKSNNEYSKMKGSLRRKIDSIQQSISSSKINTKRLFEKFPRTSFNLKEIFFQRKSEHK